MAYLYSDWITQLRKETKDLDKLYHQRFDGDASTTQFQVSTYPIKDNSYTVKIDGVTKTEGTDYTLDKDIGLFEFASAPAAGSDNVSIEYRALKLRDTDWLNVSNDAIDYFRDMFWTEEIDSTSLTSVIDQYDYDLTTLLTKVPVAIMSVEYIASGSTDWSDVCNYTNWVLFKDKNYLHFNKPFTTTGLKIKIRYLATYTQGNATTTTFPVQAKWRLPYKYFCFAKFYERTVPDRIENVAMVNTLPTYLPPSMITNLVEYYYRKADETARKIAPTKPAVSIQHLVS